MSADLGKGWALLDRGAAGQLEEHEELLLGVVQDVVKDRIAPRAAAYDRSGAFPSDNMHDLNDELKLNGVFIPAEYGGAGLSYRCFLRLVELISAGCGSTAITWATTFHAMSPVIDFGTVEQRAEFLPRIANGALAALAITEPDAGSDVAAMSTRFTPELEEIVVSGTKAFITNGDRADLYLVFGKWDAVDDPREALGALVIEKGAPGLVVLAKEDKLGHRASSTVGLGFVDCRVPKQNVVAWPGDGFRVLTAALNKSRPSTAAQALGIARASLEDAVQHVNERRQFGQRLIDFQGVQFMLADMLLELALAETWLWHVGTLVDEGVSDYSLEASAAKLAASDAAMRITTNAVQLLGGYGYSKELRVERLFRDAKLTQIWEGANEIHRQRIGQSLQRPVSSPSVPLGSLATEQA